MNVKPPPSHHSRIHLSHTHSYIHTHTHSLTYLQSYTYNHIQTHKHKHTHTLSLSRTHTHLHSHKNTHTNTTTHKYRHTHYLSHTHTQKHTLILLHSFCINIFIADVLWRLEYSLNGNQRKGYQLSHLEIAMGTLLTHSNAPFSIIKPHCIIFGRDVCFSDSGDNPIKEI